MAYHGITETPSPPPLTDIENPVEPHQIHACPRRNSPKKTIICFVNRKHADKCLFNSSKLKGIDKKKFELPLNHAGLFINESLCRPLELCFSRYAREPNSIVQCDFVHHTGPLRSNNREDLSQFVTNCCYACA